ncbi:MAG: hypothetical protein AMJ92_05585 [candidate division Zixibacteria bacterium SM23_81]|nr:MAG: hypothetical protein AMJ92_05585 [candidate division Zixibacteria bacterium SM23_81]
MLHIRAPLKEIIWGGLLLLWLTSLARSPAYGDPRLDSLSLKSELQKGNSPGLTTDSWWTRDKRLHLVVSAGMVGVGFHLLHDRWLCEAEDSRIMAVSLTALGCVIKEVTDKRKTPPTCSYKDLAADGLGILVGLFLFTH